MKTENEEFQGWTLDDRTAHTYAPIQYRQQIKALFFIPFWILIGAGILRHFTGFRMPEWLIWTVFSVLAIGFILAIILGKMQKKAPTCFKCRNPMKIVKTVPTPAECLQTNYTIGPSGHVYSRLSSQHGDRAVEIRKSWYTCPCCKKYVLLDPEVQVLLGAYPEAIDQREADYKRLAKQRMEIAKSLHLGPKTKPQ